MIDFNAEEIFRMAEQLERNGSEFYRSAAAAAARPEENDLLLRLAAMEDAHQKTFQTMRSELGDLERSATAFDPDGEATQYLRALADTRVFFQKKIDTSSMKEILKAAIEAEKESILFYLGMRATLPTRLGQSRLDEIIQEEMGHIRMLSRELVRLKE
ncbi:MAG: ferritin family protein [Desulfobacteraceae bacterium]|jgi:rubrerythrin|nr:ferritin family protein [Desulfobacteraceae bacterium]